jgi:carboxylesterase type B
VCTKLSQVSGWTEKENLYVVCYFMCYYCTGIIARAIMESGCGQSPGAYNTPVQALSASLAIVNVSSCAPLNTNLTAVVACLKQMDTATLVQLLKKVRYIPPTLLPTTDNYFLTDTPNNLLAQGRWVNVTGILLGTNTYEGRFLIERIFPQLKNGSVVADVSLFNQV